jgi:hypothetical protein
MWHCPSGSGSSSSSQSPRPGEGTAHQTLALGYCAISLPTLLQIAAVNTSWSVFSKCLWQLLPWLRELSMKEMEKKKKTKSSSVFYLGKQILECVNPIVPSHRKYMSNDRNHLLNQRGSHFSFPWSHTSEFNVNFLLFRYWIWIQEDYSTLSPSNLWAISPFTCYFYLVL